MPTSFQTRQRVPCGPTGALSVLPHFLEATDGRAVGAHVAYPSGDAVVVVETHVGFPSTFSRVTFAGEPGGDGDQPTCVSWAPGETHCELLVARGDEIHLCSVADDDAPRRANRVDAPPSEDTHDHDEHGHAWYRYARAKMAGKVVACAWTTDGSGVVASDATGVVAAWRCRDDADEAPGAGDTNGDTSTSDWQWRCQADEPQTRIAAGCDIASPVATTATASREVRVWRQSNVDGPGNNSRGLWQTLLHPSEVTSMRWRVVCDAQSGRTRKNEKEKEKHEHPALVTTSVDGAARVWTVGCGSFGDGWNQNQNQKLVMSIVVQTTPGPQGTAPVLLDASFLAWCPETAQGGRRRVRDASGGDSNKNENEIEIETETETETQKSQSFASASAPSRDGAEFLCALGSDGVVWVWMLDGLDVCKHRTSARVPRAHLWRRESLVEKNQKYQNLHQRMNLQASKNVFFSCAWAHRGTTQQSRTNREKDKDAVDTAYVPRSDPPPLRVVVASPSHGARVCHAELCEKSDGAATASASGRTPVERVTLERSAFFRGHAFGDTLTHMRVCDTTGAVASLDVSGTLRVWRWVRGFMKSVFLEESTTETKKNTTAATWCRGALFIATEFGIEQFSFCGDDKCKLIRVASGIDVDLASPVVALDVVETASDSTRNAFALLATGQNGCVVGYRLEETTFDGCSSFTIAEPIGSDTIDIPSCRAGTVPCVVPTGRRSTSAFALACVQENAIGLFRVEEGFGKLVWTRVGRLCVTALDSVAAISSSPTGASLCVARKDGTTEVWSAEGCANGGFARTARFRVGDENGNGNGNETPCVAWFAIGSDAEAVLVACGTRVELRVARRGAWDVLASANVDASIGCLAWSARDDAVVVGVGHELVTLALLSSITRTIETYAQALPEYHPKVLMDWLVRGETRRARAAARRIRARLAGGSDENNEKVVTVATLLEESSFNDSELDTTTAAMVPPEPPNHSVPEFDMGAFGGFGGFGAPAPAPAKFGFGAATPNEMSGSANSSSVASQSPHSSDTGNNVSTTGTTPSSSGKFTPDEADSLAELVGTKGRFLPGLTSADLMDLLAAIDALRDADADAADLNPTDAAGTRFMTIGKARGLCESRNLLTKTQTLGPSGEELAWVLHSDKQDALLSITGSDPDQKINWPSLRKRGVPLWIRDDTAFRNLCDQAARQAFSDTKDPAGETPCALLFVALGRQSVLAGLCRATRKVEVADFFARDFSDTRNKQAALKNAYALLSKHRYLFAAAFFVLAGQPKDAAQLVWRHTRDLSLAVAVVRLAGDANSEETETDSNGTAKLPENTHVSGSVKRVGGEAHDDGMLSMAAFGDFGAPAMPTPAPPRATVSTREHPQTSAAPNLPFTLPSAAKSFIRDEIIPGLQKRHLEVNKSDGNDAITETGNDDVTGETIELKWTLAALRWVCGDGAGSIAGLGSLARSGENYQSAVSAADLLLWISKRKALLVAVPLLATVASEQASTGTKQIVLLLEQQNMTLAALERLFRNGKRRVGVGTEKSVTFKHGGVDSAAAKRAQDGVLSRLAAAALAPEMRSDRVPNDSLAALVRLANKSTTNLEVVTGESFAESAFSEDAQSATKASLAFRRETISFLPEVFGLRPVQEDPALMKRVPHGAHATQPPTTAYSRATSLVDLQSVDLDPNASYHEKTPETPSTPLAGLKRRIGNKLRIKIHGSPIKTEPHRDGSPGSPETNLGSPPATPGSPSTPDANAAASSGFDVLMPGFGVSVLAETRNVPAAKPATFVSKDTSSDTVGTTRDSSPASKPHNTTTQPSRALRAPVEIARLANDAFYAVCVNPAVPHQLGLGCVRKGLVVADLQRLGASSSQTAPDGRAVVGAASVLQTASVGVGTAALFARRDGGFGAGGLDSKPPWPRSDWRRPKRNVRRAMQSVGSKDQGQETRDTQGQGNPKNQTQLDAWQTAAANLTAAATAAAHAVGAVDANLQSSRQSATPSFSSPPCGGSHLVPGDVVARCVESHPQEPVLLAGDGFGLISVWRFGPLAQTFGALGTVRLPSSRARTHGAGSNGSQTKSGQKPLPVSKYYNSKTGNSVTTELSTGVPSVADVAWDPSGARFAGGGSDGAIAVWRSDQNFCQNAEPFFFRPPPTPTSRVEQLSFASSTAICAVGSHLDCDGASFVLWDTLCPARAAAAMKAHQVIISRRTNPMTVCRLSRVLDCTARLFAHTIY